MKFIIKKSVLRDFLKEHCGCDGISQVVITDVMPTEEEAVKTTIPKHGPPIEAIEKIGTTNFSAQKTEIERLPDEDKLRNTIKMLILQYLYQSEN